MIRFAALVACPTLGALHFTAPTAVAQYQAPSETLQLTAKTATTWTDAGVDVVILDGPATISFDQATLSAKQAVIWLAREAGNEPGRRRAQVVLLGDAKVVQQGAVRSGDRMLVNGSVAGRIRLSADERIDRNLADSPTYKRAEAIRDGRPDPEAANQPATRLANENGSVTPATGPSTRPTTVATRAATRPATGPATARAATGPSLAEIPGATTQPAAAPVYFEAPDVELIQTDDGTVAAVLSRGVKLIHRRETGDLIEMQGQRVVLFTPIKDLRELQRKGGGIKEVQDAVTAVYVEGDARMVYTPFDQAKLAEQRLQAAKLYYEFATDRAVLTQAVLHTVDPTSQLPIIVHARTIRQLAKGEFRTDDAELSTSQFATPTYSIRASKIYVRQNPPTEEGPGGTSFLASNTTFHLFGVPFFWLPAVGGEMGEQTRLPIRSIGFEQSSMFGTTVYTGWGLFETFGQLPPKDLDAVYRLDYYNDRGPGGGLEANYQGGSLTETGRQPWSFDGDFTSYFVYDKGTDEIGRPLTPREEDDYRLRGHAQWEHQHILPDGWVAQLRAGWVSDATFLEQWFPRQFDRGLPHDVSAYLKRQRDTEAFTLLYQFQPNDIITTSDLVQEQFEVEHVPEIGYRRIGDSVLRDRATFTSENLVGGLRFQGTRYSEAEQGFYPTLQPGIPSLGTTGTTDDTVWRGDFRQELAYPITTGRFRVVPYVMGRYTAYSDSPDGDPVHRLFGGAGVRLTTAFWKADDTVRNELFDIHRVRHVIEPELHLFTSATTEDRGDVFIFDEQVDPVNDVQAMQIALRQRWQTYRGGPGRWRSVDFFALNVEANLFNNQPTLEQRNPDDFRGLFFPSYPELSVARNSINADALWRVADTTAVLADVNWNADLSRLATASFGLLALRDERTMLYLGNRYIENLNSNITTAVLSYQLNTKYTFVVSQSFDFGLGENVVSGLSVIRKFDAFTVVFKAYMNETTEQSGVGFTIIPRGLNVAADTDVINSTIETQRLRSER